MKGVRKVENPSCEMLAARKEVAAYTCDFAEMLVELAKVDGVAGSDVVLWAALDLLGILGLPQGHIERLLEVVAEGMV